MSISATFIAQTRDDLIKASRTLGANIDDEAISNPKKPILWSNHGTWRACKSLLVKEVIYGATNQETEFSNYGSFLTDNMQFQFWDIPYPFDSESCARAAQLRDLDVAKKRQNKAGIIFVHNAPDIMQENGADIDIKISQRKNVPYVYRKSLPPLTLHRLWKSGLSDEFYRLGQDQQQEAFLIELSIHNPNIFKPGFIEQLQCAETMSRTMRGQEMEATL